MKLPFLASFIVFIVWLSFTITRSRRVMENQEKAFWEREKQDPEKVSGRTSLYYDPAGHPAHGRLRRP